MWAVWRKKKAMQVADGVAKASSDVDQAEVLAFQNLSGALRDAMAPRLEELPPFETMWAGVERLCAEEARPSEVRASPPVWAGLGEWLRRLLFERPTLVLAPAGALVLALVLALFVAFRPGSPNNRCYVDSYDAGSGTVLIEQDMDDPAQPTVIWYLPEG